MLNIQRIDIMAKRFHEGLLWNMLAHTQFWFVKTNGRRLRH